MLDLCLRINRPVPEPILKTLMRDTLRGLVYLHESAFIHRFAFEECRDTKTNIYSSRDIKAENILLTEAGVVKLSTMHMNIRITSSFL